MLGAVSRVTKNWCKSGPLSSSHFPGNGSAPEGDQRAVSLYSSGSVLPGPAEAVYLWQEGLDLQTAGSAGGREAGEGVREEEKVRVGVDHCCQDLNLCTSF